MDLIYEKLSTRVYDSIFTVHRALGPGLLESTYEICLKKELEDSGLLVEQQKALPILYKGVELEAGYRVDLMVEKSNSGTEGGRDHASHLSSAIDELS